MGTIPRSYSWRSADARPSDRHQQNPGTASSYPHFDVDAATQTPAVFLPIRSQQSAIPQHSSSLFVNGHFDNDPINIDHPPAGSANAVANPYVTSGQWPTLGYASDSNDLSAGLAPEDLFLYSQSKRFSNEQPRPIASDHIILQILSPNLKPYPVQLVSTSATTYPATRRGLQLICLLTPQDWVRSVKYNTYMVRVLIERTSRFRPVLTRKIRTCRDTHMVRVLESTIAMAVHRISTGSTAP